jgi:hypothetical protein
MNRLPWRIVATSEEDLPVVGEQVRAGDYVAVCTKIEWAWLPPYDGDPVEGHSREVIEACVRMHGGSVGCRGVYSVTWLAPGARTAEGMPDHGGGVVTG